MVITTEIITLTPEMAKELLSKNSDNRPLSQSTVSKYTQAIKRGEWMLNGEPIIIFSNGNIASGQHRCHAVIAAGLPIQTLIVRNVDHQTFSSIDTGKSRNGADVLAIRGDLNYTKLSAAARSYLVETLKGRDQYQITTAQICECVDKHPHLRYWVQKFVGQKALQKTCPAGLCGLLACASEKYGFEKLDVFFAKLATGKGLEDGDPAYVLRERLISQSGSSKLSVTHVRAFMIKAINACLLDKKIPFLRLTKDEDVPKII